MARLSAWVEQQIREAEAEEPPVVKQLCVLKAQRTREHQAEA